MKRKTILGLVIGVLVLVGGAAVYALYIANESSKSATSTTPDRKTNTEKIDEKSNLLTGRYTDYSPANVAADGYDETIIFFHAPWCPECRGFENAIKTSNIPDGVQILKADYDSSTDLRKKYGVTIQTTFVKVDGKGNKQSLWSGYGKDKSVDTILENT